MNILAEKKLWKQGYKLVAGIDEAGRGPLAGPVVAGAVLVLSDNLGKELFALIKDSKQLSEKQRQAAYDMLIKEPNIIFGIGKVNEKEIDKINIFQATKLAMKKAVDDLIKKTNKHPDCLIIDGKHKINMDVEQKPIIKADTKIFSCSAASIIAKVTRDKLMDKFHKQYPEYGFAQHKGYGTKLHFAMLKKHGACKIHRKTFAPIKYISISAS
ncbi:MAG: ribonuclease HII [Candidatus Paceibacterota bacterium]